MAITTLAELRRLTLLALADGPIKELVERYFDDFESSVRARIENVNKLLAEIIEQSGAFNRNPLIHAENVMENSSQKAKESIKIINEVLGEAEGRGAELK